MKGSALKMQNIRFFSGMYLDIFHVVYQLYFDIHVQLHTLFSVIVHICMVHVIMLQVADCFCMLPCVAGQTLEHACESESWLS